MPISDAEKLSAWIRVTALISRHRKSIKGDGDVKNDKICFKRYWSVLIDGKVYLHMHEKADVMMVMQVDYFHIRLRQEKGGSWLISFKNKRFSQEIIFETQEEAYRWYAALNRVCIYSRFFSQFTISNMLGAGNYARVFSVVRQVDKKQFACKSFSKEAALKDEIDMKSLLNEVAMLRSMNHQNIMPLEMLYEGSQFVYCLSPLYSGGSLLNAVIREGNFSQFRSMVYLKQLLMAAAYLETKDYLHRDIKPENVLLTEGGKEVVLVDFGFSTKREEYDQLFVRCGTPGYVAPEILQDVPYDARVDVFSIGVILYVMLTGNVPFACEDADELIEINARCEVDFDLSKFGVDVEEESKLLVISSFAFEASTGKRSSKQAIRFRINSA